MNVLLTESFEYDLVGDGQVLTESKPSDRSAGTSQIHRNDYGNFTRS